MGLKRIITSLFFVSLAVWVICAFNKERLPPVGDILPSLLSQPTPTSTTKGPFNVTKDGITYNIQPLYNYELYGLIMSHHNASSIDDLYHEQWKDYINTKDICVVFGDNVRTDIYQRIKFNSGSWTCWYQLDNAEDGSIFKAGSMSNNHLLTENPEINNKVIDAIKGDQIYMKGYIVKYGKGSDPKRGYDTFTLGKGECQIVYLTDFQVLNQNPWKWLSLIFKWLTLLLGGFWIVKYFFMEKILTFPQSVDSLLRHTACLFSYCRGRR